MRDLEKGGIANHLHTSLATRNLYLSSTDIFYSCIRVRHKQEEFVRYTVSSLFEQYTRHLNVVLENHFEDKILSLFLRNLHALIEKVRKKKKQPV